MIALRKHEFRGDFEVIDAQHICRGFIWKYADRWAVRIDNLQTQFVPNYNEAAGLARSLCQSPRGKIQ